MDRHRLLLALLLAWIVAVTGGGLWRLLALGDTVTERGPLALARDGRGGLFVATGRELLHLDAQGALRARHPVATLGLRDIDALAAGEGDHFFLFDGAQRRLFRCESRAWRCAGIASPRIERGVQLGWVYGRERRLLASDNHGHRLLAFAENGEPLPLPAMAWRYPNQVSSSAGEVLLADSDARRIVVLDPVANTALGTALATRERPYRFTRRDTTWWVIEAGTTLERGRLRHYAGGEARDLPLPARDPVALVDLGHGIAVASQADWQLLRLDPDTGAITAFGDAALRDAFRERREAIAAARRERALLPWLMLALAAPALAGGLLLQRRLDRERRGKAAPVPAAGATVSPGVTVRIDTDRDALATARTQQNRQLLRAGVVLVPLLLLPLPVLYATLPVARPWLPSLAGVALALPLLVALLVYAGRRGQDRHYDQHLICGPDRLVHVVGGKPRQALPYSEVWLGEDSLVLGRRRLPLQLGRGPQRCALWNAGELHRALGPRLPAAQRLGELALARALLARGRLAGLQVLAARFALALAVILALMIKLWQLLPHHLPGLLRLPLP